MDTKSTETANVLIAHCKCICVLYSQNVGYNNMSLLVLCCWCLSVKFSFFLSFLWIPPCRKVLPWQIDWSRYDFPLPTPPHGNYTFLLTLPKQRHFLCLIRWGDLLCYSRLPACLPACMLHVIPMEALTVTHASGHAHLGTWGERMWW